MRLAGQVIGVNTVGKKIRIIFETDKSDLQNILKLQSNRPVESEILIDDNRQISSKQRAKIFACIKDFSLYTGYEAEYARQLFTLSFCYEEGIEPFSLSDCSMEIAREFITYLVNFCIETDIPLSTTPLERTDDINAYCYMCLKNHICMVCGEKAIVYETRNGKICLCNKHHDEGKRTGLESLQEKFKIYPLKIK